MGFERGFSARARAKTRTTPEKSRLLRGAPVDEAEIEHEPHLELAQFAATAMPLRWLHATRAAFELPDKRLELRRRPPWSRCSLTAGSFASNGTGANTGC